MGIFEILTIILSITLVVVILLTIFGYVKLTKLLKKNSFREAESVDIRNKTRFSTDATIFDEEGNQKTSFIQSDIILKKGDIEKVFKKSKIKPGKYTILSARENEKEIKVRLNGLVTTFSHGDTLILKEGEEIGGISSFILR